MAYLRSVGAVKALVYDTVFKRAQEIAASDKLRAVVFDGETLLKGRAECIGSSPSDFYVLSVSINEAAAVGNCSCPAGKNAKSGLCKHVVALLLRRIQLADTPRAGPSRSSSDEELTISVASQIDDIETSQEARKSTGGGGVSQSSMSRSAGTHVSSSKRALPAWMLGVTGSAAAAQAESSNPPKSKKRAVPPKPPLHPPPPTKRVRRSGQPLRISINNTDQGEEDPGEVEDAGPMQEGSSGLAAVIEEDEAAEAITLPTEGAAARERRRLRALKNEEDVLARSTGHAEAEKGRDRPRRSVTKAVESQPARSSKRKRLIKKYVEEEDNDVSEKEIAPLNNGFCLTDDDLMFLAQEQVESDKTAEQAKGSKLNTPAEPLEVTKTPEKPAQGKKSSSIFSMNNWKELSGNVDTGGALSLTADDLNLETLKNYSLGPTSLGLSQFDTPSLDREDTAGGMMLPSLPTLQAATLVRDTTPLAAAATGFGETDAVANDMLHLLFGPTLGGNVAVAASSTTPSTWQDNHDQDTIAVGLVAPVTSSIQERPDFASTNPVYGVDVDDHPVESKPKKKGSLKDRVKMFLS